MTPAVVVLGGTFDPVHRGHIAVLEQVLDRTGVQHGVLLPAATPNLRAPAAAPAAARLDMARAAVGGHPRLEVSDLEVRRGGMSYTVDTVPALAERYGEPVALLLGADAARRIQGWHRAEALLDRAAFVVVNRSGEAAIDAPELAQLGYPAARTLLLDVDSPPVRAAMVRARIAAGESIAGLVPDAVAHIIERKQLYRDRSPCA